MGNAKWLSFWYIHSQKINFRTQQERILQPSGKNSYQHFFYKYQIIIYIILIYIDKILSIINFYSLKIKIRCFRDLDVCTFGAI